MKKSILLFTVLLSVSFGIFPVNGQNKDDKVSVGKDNRGDPPYLLESGWIPMLNSKNMEGWDYVPKTGQGGWTTTPAVIWDETDAIFPLKGAYVSGDRIVNTTDPGKKIASDIYTVRKFGDMELYLEFMVSQKSNSGVYVHGLYEVQIINSYGKDPSSPGSICGSIYDYEEQENGKFVGGVFPLIRAEQPCGRWQSLYIHFQAPRFNSIGEKISNAKFIAVMLNGITIQKNIERKGMTRSGMKIGESEENPLMLQGNHGPIAYRNIYIHPLSSPGIE